MKLVHQPLMSRDHRKLRVFADAHNLSVAIYEQTRDFPRDEWFGLRLQMRRAAVSVACNIVEGNARRSTADYLRFLHTALGSACELKYLIELVGAIRLMDGTRCKELAGQSDAVVRQLEMLTTRMEEMLCAERAGALQDRRPKAGARNPQL